MMGEQLKPCPFCGGKPEYKEFHDDNGGVECYYREWSHYIIECECGCQICSPISKGKVIEAWNRRINIET